MAGPWTGEFSFLGNDPNINEELRRRIALQMLSSGKKGFPKNIGEGLTAIGDAIGDRGIMSRLAAEEAASERAGSAAVSRLSGPQAYAPPDDVPQEPAAAPAPATPPVPLFTAPEQPASMLRPELPTGLGGASTGGVGPESMYTSPNRLGMPPQPPVQATGADRWPQQSAALSGIETGGAKDPYAMLHAVTKSGDRAYGKYGIMGANIPGWTRDALGRSLTPQQFLADRDAQEATAKHRFQNYANKYGEEGAARAWFGGEGGMKNLGATDVHGRLNVGTYGQDFMRRMGGPQAAASPRDLVAAQLVAQGQDPVEPQQQATLGSPILPQGMNAVPPQQPIRAMPQQQPVRVAQAGPPAAGYVMPQQPTRAPPPTTTPTLQNIQREIAQTPPANRAAVARAFEPYIKQEQAKITDAHTLYKDQLIQDRAMELERQKQLANQRKSIDESEKHTAEIAKLKDEERIRRQFAGLPPNLVFEEMTKSKDAATKASAGYTAANNARKAINAGAITGIGADARLDWHKLLSAMGAKSSADAVTNTETFRSAIAPVVASVLAATVGSQGISNADREFAAAAAGGSIRLDATSIRRIVDITGRAAREVLDSHQRKLDTLFPDSPQGTALFGVKTPEFEKEQPLMSKQESQEHQEAQEWLKANPNDPRAPKVRKKLGIM
jgi:hypothetical protein